MIKIIRKNKNNREGQRGILSNYSSNNFIVNSPMLVI